MIEMNEKVSNFAIYANRFRKKKYNNPGRHEKR